MKAMVYKEYGSPDYLRLKEIEVPAVKENEVLVKVHASSVNWIDWHFLMGKPFLARIMAGLFKPKNKVLGIDLAGHVEAVGENVKGLQPGDEVFGSTSHGCFAEYVCVHAEGVVAKPAKVTFEEAAALPGAATPALQALRDLGKIQPKQEVLINGASGGVGTFAVQIAKSMGADVTGVCSTSNLEMVKAIGADHVIDYTQGDFTQHKEPYDLVFDVVAKSSFLDCKGILSSEGIYITSEFSPWLAILGQWISMTRGQKMVPLPPKPPSKRDLVLIKELHQGGKISPVIDRSYKLSDLPEALRYLEKGHARGKIIITI